MTLDDDGGGEQTVTGLIFKENDKFESNQLDLL